MKILQSLNESQKEAVRHIDGAMLILAGAGSGKTKTITTRLAYLIDEVGIPAQSTLTLTFTNKAAMVMKTRALELIREKDASPLLCTFHKFGLMFLRLHIARLGRKNDFVVIDSDDVKKILKEIIGAEKDNVNFIMSEISRFKNMGFNADMVFEEVEKYKDDEQNYKKYFKLATCYKNYQNYLLRYNFVDFDDLLLLTCFLLEDEEFAKIQSQIYRYIMVDEYQDTNFLQHKILKSLCKSHENLCVVGDDDQSIYSWRGAKVENILNFQNEFEKVKLVKLEQNYRSVGTILKAANELIAHNQKRLGKTLICTKDEGDEIEICACEDEREESAMVARKIKALLDGGVKMDEIAVLFRVNALSRALEEALMKEKIPYLLLSGMRFYERAEIKDMIAYLRLINNLEDDFSFKRIINRPKRGFGEVALQKLEKHAQIHQISLFEALCNLEGSGVFSQKLQNELRDFIENIKSLRELSSLKEVIEQLDERFKFKEFYEKQNESEDKIANINEFCASLKDRIENENIESLEEILSEISLLSEQDKTHKGVCIMSVHTSKGLEFDYVFVIGLEMGFFPVGYDNIEEERRLAYVAFTRAKKRLSLSYVNSRFHQGSRAYLQKSCFLEESGVLDKEIEVSEGFKKGDLVRHKIFGVGRVVGVNEDKLNINFGGIERIILDSYVERAV
ncbi:ATP-dependent helicase [Campylobacter helveticus]|uniref:DNA 3'-5' helicase n=1 Tax=Campylobacter helveticus TaxID=28898 RepID=A0AAX2UKZ0_9BACT|nr:UvrD-helicase domain-containing protein [Campylobacter helveticus]ARE80736.1 UvrD/REP family helicase [Campylobacter helveticus]TNB58661.1 ATP-dependent helicase [Campylobacter helveticus]TNB59300.1 ATP-dependent helicase [Campylobacter helveticus]TXK51697.1 AAA family ATPase [Campylobacter helveticus]SMC20522.1 DNA helicase-2 / ATP-dependent DNA helicase PcrA [Campylobacter helveticus]